MEFLNSAIIQTIGVPADTALSYFFCLLTGILVNWIWKCKRENIDPIQYWTSNAGSSWLTIFGAFASFITTLIMEPSLGKQTYFAMGVACDAMLNKAPLPISVQAALQQVSSQSNQKVSNE